MKFIRIFFLLIHIFCSAIIMRAQISFTPSSLTWASNETGSKVVTVHSAGYWETDSTQVVSHFMLSRYNGWDGYEVEISPLSANTGGSAITEYIAFTQGGYTVYLQLTHNATGNTLSVSPTYINCAMKENNINHIFNAKHNLDPLINICGNERNVMSMVLSAANGQYPSSGPFVAKVSLYGYDIWISGAVVNGVPKIGTMYIPF